MAKETSTSQRDIEIMRIGENLLLGDIPKHHLTPLEAQSGLITWYA